MAKNERAPRTYFGIREEYILLLLMQPVILGCMMADPFRVAVEGFSASQPSILLIYPEAGNQSFDINISKYLVQGNWSQDGVFNNFVLQICPADGSPSNIMLYLPEGSGPVMLHPGTLTECENVSVDTTELNAYFSTNSGMMLNLGTLAALVGDISDLSPSSLNFMMQRSPKIYDVDEPVVFTFLSPLVDADFVNYTCSPGGEERYVTSPASRIAFSMPIPPGALAALGPGGIPAGIPTSLIDNNIIKINMTIWDLPCPAYGAPGKYTGTMTAAHVYLEGFMWPDYVEVSDDFNTTELQSYWDVLQTGAEPLSSRAYVSEGALQMESPAAATGIMVYYGQNVTVGDSERFTISSNVSTANIQGPLGSGAAGVIGFAQDTSGPNDMASLTGLSGLFAFNASTVMLLCNLVDGPIWASDLDSGYHVFASSSNGGNVSFYVDGSYVADCGGADNVTAYFGMSSDPLTDMWSGNMSVEWVNVSIEDWNGSDWVRTTHYDTFSSLNASAWIVRNNTVDAGVSYYENDAAGSQINLSSSSSTGASGIIVYYSDPVIYAGGDSRIAAKIVPNRTAFENDGGMAAFFLSTAKMQPAGGEVFNSSVRAAILFNQTSYFMTCDLSDPYAMNAFGDFAPGDPANPEMQINLSSSYITLSAEGNELYSCYYSGGDDLYLGFSPDPYTDQWNGNLSVGLATITSLNIHNTTGWRWLDTNSPGWELLIGAGASFNFSSDVIVRDCPSQWDCKYGFLMSSDTPGAVNVSITNITYENLVQYSHGAPTVNMSGTQIFSWIAANSTIINSTMRYQSSAINSRIVNSTLVMSNVEYVNVTNSTLMGVIRLTKFDNSSISSLLGLGVPSISVAPHKYGEIKNSTLVGVVLFGGSVYNSTLSGTSGIFMDFYGANMDNYTLRRGRVVVNMSRYGAEAADWLSGAGMDNRTFDIGFIGRLVPIAPPFACDRGSTFAAEGFPVVRVADLNGSFACNVELHNISMVFSRMNFSGSTISGPASVLGGSAASGPVISLDNASVVLANQSGPLNVRIVNGEASITFYGLDASTEPVVFDSNYHYLTSRIVAFNSSFYGWLNGTTATIAFTNLSSFSGTVYYYPEFTDDPAVVQYNGTVCNESICSNVIWNPGSKTLMFDVNTYSTYSLGPAVNTTAPREDEPASPSSMFVSVNANSTGQPVWFFTTQRGGAPLEGVGITVREPDSHLIAIKTDANGSGQFVPRLAGLYEFTATKAGYYDFGGLFVVNQTQAALPENDSNQTNQTVTPPANQTNQTVTPPEPQCTSDSNCLPNQACSGGVCVLVERGTCGRIENHKWVPYECCSQSECGQGLGCMENRCVQSGTTNQSTPGETPQGQSEGLVAGQSCCAMGVCGTILGMCWFKALAIGALVLALIGAVVAYQRRGKQKKKR
jgi:hypothetical protein